MRGLKRIIQALRVEMKSGNYDLLRWIIGSQIALMGILFAATKLL